MKTPSSEKRNEGPKSPKNSIKNFFIKSKKTTDRASEALQNNSEIELSSIDEI